MNNPFLPATKQKAKLRLAISGASGSGKTLSALRIAAGIGGKIALIDTEAGSASKYAGRYGIQFDTIAMQHPTIDNTVKLLGLAADYGYSVVIIDSLSHAWQELLAEMDKLANSKYKGNSFRAWSEGTPQQQKLTKAIISSPLHIIATMRVKTEWVVEPNQHGKAAPRKIGTSPEQGKGIEYEFDMLIEMDQYHQAFISKDRTGEYQDKSIPLPDEDFGKALAAWLEDGVNPVQVADSEVDKAPDPVYVPEPPKRQPVPAPEAPKVDDIDACKLRISDMFKELINNMIDRWDVASRREESTRSHLGTEFVRSCLDLDKLKAYEIHMANKVIANLASIEDQESKGVAIAQILVAIDKLEETRQTYFRDMLKSANSIDELSAVLAKVKGVK